MAQMVKNLPAMPETWVQSLSVKIPWRSAWQPTPVFLSGESHGQRSLGATPWGHKELHIAKQLTLLNMSCLPYLFIINIYIFYFSN